MELAGLCKAVALYRDYDFSFGTLNAISEVFHQSTIIDRFDNDAQKWIIARRLGDAVEDFLAFAKNLPPQ